MRLMVLLAILVPFLVSARPGSGDEPVDSVAPGDTLLFSLKQTFNGRESSDYMEEFYRRLKEAGLSSVEERCMEVETELLEGRAGGSGTVWGSKFMVSCKPRSATAVVAKRIFRACLSLLTLPFDRDSYESLDCKEVLDSGDLGATPTQYTFLPAPPQTPAVLSSLWLQFDQGNKKLVEVLLPHQKVYLTSTEGIERFIPDFLARFADSCTALTVVAKKRYWSGDLVLLLLCEERPWSDLISLARIKVCLGTLDPENLDMDSYSFLDCGSILEDTSFADELPPMTIELVQHGNKLRGRSKSEIVWPISESADPRGATDQPSAVVDFFR